MKKILYAIILFLLAVSVISCSKSDNTSVSENKDSFYVLWIGSDSFIGGDSNNKNYLIYCDTCEISVGDTRIVSFDNSDISEESGSKILSTKDSSTEIINYEYKILNIADISTPDDKQGEITDIAPKKPVIYLYPETETKVSVKLDLDGKFTCTYPEYNNGWTVTASPDGTLTDQDGKQYYCLYWEGKTNNQYEIDKGFVVAGKDTASFLRDKLLYLGLTEREAEEFIIYWLPQMQDNPYNMIYFAEKDYTDSAVLNINPMPDTLLRIMMVWKPCDEKVDLPEQTLAPTERKGFTVVEWGGCHLGIN